MRLLFDNNLSERLVELLAADFADCVHVRSIGIARSADQDIWDYAKAMGLAIVSKDADFHQMSFLHGPPPKVVWIRRGNCSTDEMALLLRRHAGDIGTLGTDSAAAFLANS